MADENIHEGWNYHKWNDSSQYPRYRFYRFYHPTDPEGCLLNEIKMTGVETVDNTDADIACPIALESHGEIVKNFTE